LQFIPEDILITSFNRIRQAISIAGGGYTCSRMHPRVDANIGSFSMNRSMADFVLSCDFWSWMDGFWYKRAVLRCYDTDTSSKEAFYFILCIWFDLAGLGAGWDIGWNLPQLGELVEISIGGRCCQCPATQGTQHYNTRLRNPLAIFRDCRRVLVCDHPMPMFLKSHHYHRLLIVPFNKHEIQPAQRSWKTFAKNRKPNCTFPIVRTWLEASQNVINKGKICPLPRKRSIRATP